MKDNKCDTSTDKKNKRGIFLTIGVIFSAIIASVCCWLPVLLITLGLSAAGVSSFFGPLRPYFIAITIILLVFAFYFSYRTPADTQSCCDTLKVKKRRFLTRMGLWLMIVLVVIIISYPYYGGKLISTGKKNINPTHNRQVHLPHNLL